MGKLTDVQLRTWIKAGKPIAKADGSGLTFTLSSKGTAAWVLRYYFAGKPRELTLGRYPELSLAEARRLAAEKRAEIQRGIDVATEKQRAKLNQATALTVRSLANEWFQREIVERVKYPQIIRRTLDRHILPHIGALPVEEVRPAHIDRALQAIVADGAPTVANDALRHIRRMFHFARKRHWIESNPAADFEAADAGGQEQPRERFLSRAEMVALFAAIRDTPNFGRENALAIKLLLALCVRKMELLAARWEEFDLDAGVWELPGERTKTGKTIRIPLVPQVIEWLKELRVFACGSPYLFPARRIIAGRFPHVSPDTLNAALKRLNLAGIVHFVVHDLRRTARTHLAELGVSPEVAERALNHQIKGVEGRYNRHDYFQERRTALVLWASFIQTCEAAQDWNVVALKPAVA
ncbi:MAG: tyrosine-type recombinase/integrase [Candidatus Competibacteraceae bacterium]